MVPSYLALSAPHDPMISGRTIRDGRPGQQPEDGAKVIVGTKKCIKP